MKDKNLTETELTVLCKNAHMHVYSCVQLW